MLELITLGPTSIQINGLPFMRRVDSRRMLLLAYLAESQKPQPRRKMAHLLWPTSTEEHGLARLRTLINRMKQDGFMPYIDSQRRVVGLQLDQSFRLDLHELRTLLQDVKKATPQQLYAAFELYEGEFLADAVLDDFPQLAIWARSIQVEIEHLLVQGALKLIPLLLEQKETAKAVQVSHRLIQFEPYNDQAELLYLHSLFEDSQVAKAMRHLADYRVVIEQEFPSHVLSPELDRFSQIFEGVENLHNRGAILSISDLHSPGAHAAEEQLPNTKPEDVYPFAEGNAQRFAIPPQELIGRSSEATQLATLLENGHRLISVVGLGGVGKTYFVRSQIPILIQNLGNVTYFVDLRPGEIDLSQPRVEEPRAEEPRAEDNRIEDAAGKRLLPALASTLSIALSGDSLPFEQIASALRTADCTLILDNFESIHDEAYVVAELLDQVPTLTVLVTSRERLNLRRECVIQLNGLAAYDPSSMAKPLEPLQYGSAVTLFVRAAQRLYSDFEINDETGPTAALLCEQLGGLPLAIELVARQLNFYTLGELIAGIDSNRDLLVSNAADIPENHRAVFDMIEQMWLRLSLEARQVLPELSRFTQKWNRQAMQLIAPAEMAVYTELLNGSMMQQVEPGVFTLHPLVKRFAASYRSDYFSALTISEDGNEEELSYDKASDYYEEVLTHIDDEDNELRFELLSGLIEAQQVLGKLDEAEKLSQTLVELAIALKDPAKESLAYQVCGSLYTGMGSYVEAAEFLQKAYEIAKSSELRTLQAHIVIRWIDVLCLQRELEQARKKIEVGRSLLEKIDVPELSLKFAMNEARYLLVSGAYDRAIAIYQDGAEQAERNRKHKALKSSLFQLGVAFLWTGELEKARDVWQRVKIAEGESGDQFRLNQTYTNLALVHHMLGEYEESVALNLQALTFERKSRRVNSYTLTNLAVTYHSSGEFKKAAEFFQKSIEEKQKAGSAWSEAYSWNRYGHVLISQAQIYDADQAYREAANLLAETDLLYLHVETWCGLAYTTLFTEKLDEARSYADQAWDGLEQWRFTGEWDWARSALYLTEVLTALNDDRAHQLLAMAHVELIARADKLDTSESRERFLNQIEPHRQIGELYAQNLPEKR